METFDRGLNKPIASTARSWMTEENPDGKLVGELNDLHVDWSRY
tara:strand:- start:949 stop:1080 length:132 start_codon:yes stop_codon:yes gene_type:complete